jgi:hypothetical protein
VPSSMSSPPPHRASGDLLRDRLIVLAGTPDGDHAVPRDLIAIAQLAADRIAAVDYASVTGQQGDGYTTVAASAELARAVDQAQYADGGPCVEALDSGDPTVVEDISAVMRWPGFRETAIGIGLRASLSIPLFAGRGTPIAALNLYGRDSEAMRRLSAAVLSVYDPARVAWDARDDLDRGAGGLIAGLNGAFAVRAVVQQAIGVVMAITADDPAAAYASLCLRATESGVTLTQAATQVVSGQRW